jgi:pimeloyl-ACP methyl ester carboxylesterase
MSKFLYKSVGLALNLWSFFDLHAAGRYAYHLFGRTPKPVLRPKEIDFMNTARQVRSTVGEHAVTEYHWGPENGSLILLAYGWGYNAGRWRHFVPALETAGFHVVAYDPPGHGLSAGKVLNLATNSAIQLDLIARYGPVAAILAHSFGGGSAVLTAQALPPQERPARMVIMASFSSAPKIFSEYRRALGMRKALFYSMVRVLETKAGAPLRHFDMARLSGQLAQVKSLLVHDPEDQVTPFSHALRYHTFWRGSALLRATGGGHHLGNANITTAILDFLISGEVPVAAAISERTLPADHDLVRYFAGMEV